MLEDVGRTSHTLFDRKAKKGSLPFLGKRSVGLGKRREKAVHENVTKGEAGFPRGKLA